MNTKKKPTISVLEKRLKTKPSKLATMLRAELHRMLDQDPFSPLTLRMVSEVAQTSAELLMRTGHLLKPRRRKRFAAMGDSPSDYGLYENPTVDDDDDEIATQTSPPAETFGAKALREIMGALPALLAAAQGQRPIQRDLEPSLGELTLALGAARQKEPGAARERLIASLEGAMEARVAGRHLGIIDTGARSHDDNPSKTSGAYRRYTQLLRKTAAGPRHTLALGAAWAKLTAAERERATLLKKQLATGTGGKTKVSK